MKEEAWVQKFHVNQKRQKKSSSEASKGILDRASHVVKTVARQVKFGLGYAPFPKSPEAEETNPTEASNSFLRNWSRKVNDAVGAATDFSRRGMWTALGSTGGILALGGVFPEDIARDVSEGKWGRLATKGMLAGIAVSPVVRHLLTPKIPNVDE